MANSPVTDANRETPLAHEIEAIRNSSGGFTHYCHVCGEMGINLAPELPCPGECTTARDALIAEVDRLREKIHDALFLCEHSEHPYWCGISGNPCSCGATARNDVKRLIREALDGAL